ncbi:hypothetical protein [Clostridium sp. UBA4395]|uniref:hypothetical protein n=1 Tax=Clostridium sp. UBA4395 TaxID=1946360 RepID=UPI003216BD5B
MEKEVFVLSCKVDGKTIAEKAIKEMNLNVRMEKNKKGIDNMLITKEIADNLSLELRRKVDWLVDSDNVAEFHIYYNNSNYNYDVVKIKLLTWRDREYLEIKEYIELIKYVLKNEMYTTYKASTLEKVVVDMLEENETEDIYILNGLLTNGDLEFCLKDIKEFHVYNDEECIMRIYNELDGWYVIDFYNGTIEEELK